MKAYLDLRTGGLTLPPFANHTLIRANAKINDQLYFMKVNGAYLAYAPYERFAALLSAPEYDYLLTHPVLDPHLPEGLKYGTFYQNEVSRDIWSPTTTFLPTELTIFLGNSCNLSCVYCNAAFARDVKFQPEKTVKALRTLLKCYPITNISFFGNGEPLHYFSTISQIITIARTFGVNTFFLVTNGVLGHNTQRYVQFLTSNRIFTQISLDGYEAIHNLQRPKQGGAGSFREVMRTIHEFKKYGDLNHYCIARFTLTDCARQNLKQIIIFLHNLGFTNVRFAELVPEGRACQADEFTRAPDPEKAADTVVSAFILADKLGMHLTGDYDPRTPSEISPFPCPYMAGKALSLNAGGDLLCCLEDRADWIIGHVDAQRGTIQLNKERLNTIQKRNMTNFIECANCPVQCGGGCTHYSHLETGSLALPGDHRGKCSALRRILSSYLYLKLTQGESIGELY